jgi:preprotein translocase subunit YajC
MNMALPPALSMKIWHFLKFRKPEKLRQERGKFAQKLTKVTKIIYEC